MKIIKSLISFLTLVVFIVGCSGNTPQGKFVIAPEKPEAGEYVTIKYNPIGTKLEKEDVIKAFVYFYDKELVKTEEYTLKNEDGIWKATFKTDSSTKGVVVRFTDEKELITDNNENKGYVVKMFDNSGNVVPGATAGLAMCYADWGYYLEIETDRELAYKLFNEEFAKNENLKKDFIPTYLFLINRLNSQQAATLIPAELSKLEKESALDEKTIAAMINWYTQFKDSKAEVYTKMLAEKYPQAMFFQQKDYTEFRNAALEQKIEMVKVFAQKYPNSEYTQSMYNSILAEYVKTEQYAKAKEYIDANSASISPYRLGMTASSILESGKDNQLAFEIAKLGVEKASEYVSKPTEKQPEYSSVEQWKREREGVLGYNEYCLAKIQMVMGQNDLAVENIKTAFKLTRGLDADINCAYSEQLINKGEYSKAKEILEADIKNGNVSDKTEPLLKDAYTKDKNNKVSYEKYLADLKASVDAELLEKIKKDLIDVPAPDFTLLDVNGKSVSLSEFKGKTVIIDFWATWCGPCMSSFPGMKMVVEKYANDPSVKILFVNTWERVDDKLKNAKEFLAKTQYPFHVLMDDKNQVVESFKTTGIPTKYFVDKNGKIRYKSVGFSGNNEEMAKEIDLIINLIK